MSEARTVGREFVMTSCLCVLRGEPVAKLLGAFESSFAGLKLCFLVIETGRKSWRCYSCPRCFRGAYAEPPGSWRLSFMAACNGWLCISHPYPRITLLP